MPTALTVKLFAQYQACRYASVAAISVWVYDYFLTIADELELLWSRNGILVKSLYLMGRYLPIVGVSIFAGGLFPTWQPNRSNSTCRVTFTIVILCIMIQNIISLVIFTMRICTVYPMHPNIRRFLQLSLFITLSCFFTCYGVALHHMIPGMVWVPMARVCVIPNYHTWALAAIYILPIFMESLIFFSTLVHAIGYDRQLAYLGNTSTRNVLKRLYIDGTHYYGLVLGLRIGSVCIFFLASMELQMLSRYLEYLITSTLTSRYFLSFRRAILDAQRTDVEVEISLSDTRSSFLGTKNIISGAS